MLVFQHLASEFKGIFGLTSGQNMPNFGAKWAQLLKKGISPIYLAGIDKKWSQNGLIFGQKMPNGANIV